MATVGGHAASAKGPVRFLPSRWDSVSSCRASDPGPTQENGDKHLWKVLVERFPDKLKHDWLAECLKEVFTLSQNEGETLVAWTSEVQEALAKCRRKVDFSLRSQRLDLSQCQ